VFNLDKLTKRSDAPVYLFEGPRKATKAAPCFPNAVMSGFAGGANAARQIDSAPMFWRDVTLWRDADEAGARWQEATVAALQSAGVASIRVVDPVRFPSEMLAQVPEAKRHKFDVVDFIEAGMPSDAVGEAADRACQPSAISPETGPMPLAGPAMAATP